MSDERLLEAIATRSAIARLNDRLQKSEDRAQAADETIAHLSSKLDELETRLAMLESAEDLRAEYFRTKPDRW
jgi:hypothetical protein